MIYEEIPKVLRMLKIVDEQIKTPGDVSDKTWVTRSMQSIPTPPMRWFLLRGLIDKANQGKCSFIVSMSNKSITIYRESKGPWPWSQNNRCKISFNYDYSGQQINEPWDAGDALDAVNRGYHKEISGFLDEILNSEEEKIEIRSV